MRKTILVASTAFFCAGAAWADGMSVGKMQAYDNPAMRWAGPYTGAAAGFSWGKTHDKDLEVPAQVQVGLNVRADPEYITQKKTINGASYGGYVGYNWLAGNIVYGVEGNFYGTTMSNSWSQATEQVLTLDNAYVYETSHEVTWYGTGVARLGIARGPLLFYGNGGIVLGNEKSSFSATFDNVAIDGSSRHSTENHFGWTAGGGIEYAINDLFSTRIEYDHIQYNEKTVLQGTDKADVRFDTIKFGLTVKMTQ